MRAAFNPEDMPKVTITAFIEEELKKGLKDLADIERRSLSQMVAFLIERAVKDAVAKGVIKDPEKQKKDSTDAEG